MSETYALHPGSLAGASDDALIAEAGSRGMSVMDAQEAARKARVIAGIEVLADDRAKHVFLSRRTGYGEHTSYDDPLVHVSDLRALLSADDERSGL